MNNPIAFASGHTDFSDKPPDSGKVSKWRASEYSPEKYLDTLPKAKLSVA